LTAAPSLAVRLDAAVRPVVAFPERREAADCIRPSPHARYNHVRQLAVEGQILLARLVSDDPLQVTDHLRIRMGPHDRTDYVVSRADVRHPIADGFGRCVLERLGAAR